MFGRDDERDARQGALLALVHLHQRSSSAGSWSSATPGSSAGSTTRTSTRSSSTSTPLNRLDHATSRSSSASAQLLFVCNFFTSMFAGKKARDEPVGGRHARVDASRRRRRTTTSTSSRPCSAGRTSSTTPTVTRQGLARPGRAAARRGAGRRREEGRRPSAADERRRPVPAARRRARRPPPTSGWSIFLGAWAMMFAGAVLRLRASCALSADAGRRRACRALPLAAAGAQHRWCCWRSSVALALRRCARCARRGRARSRAGSARRSRSASLFLALQSWCGAQLCAAGLAPRHGHLRLGLLRAHLLPRAARAGRARRAARVLVPGALARPLHRRSATRRCGMWAMYWHFVDVGLGADVRHGLRLLMEDDMTMRIGLRLARARRARRRGGCARPPVHAADEARRQDGARPRRSTTGDDAYMQYCRPCHGDNGDGKGSRRRPAAAAARLHAGPVQVRPRAPRRRCRPTTELVRIVRGGLHGTAMLPWDVPDGELDRHPPVHQDLLAQLGRPRSRASRSRSAPDPFGAAQEGRGDRARQEALPRQGAVLGLPPGVRHATRSCSTSPRR